MEKGIGIHEIYFHNVFCSYRCYFYKVIFKPKVVKLILSLTKYIEKRYQYS